MKTCHDARAGAIDNCRCLLHQASWQNYHRVGEPVSRRFILDGKRPHTAPVIVEIGSGAQWLDSWTKACGQSPDIMTISEWKSRY
jgi:hypothetical protein